MQLSILYLAGNVMNVGVYAADALERKLPLLGGNNVYHDWNYILLRLGLLEYSNIIGGAFYWCGVILCLLALVLPAFQKEYVKADINLKL